MAEGLGTEILHLSAEFPPVSTTEWEAVIQKDLKGADYQKKLVWQPESGIAVQPYYRKAALEPLGELADLAPGQFPYTRGDGQLAEEAQNFIPPADAIRADFLHEAGATAVEELGFSLAEAIEACAAGKNEPPLFVFAIGSNYFFEIAKLRAARLLWATAVSAFDAAEKKPQTIRIHARTARANKSIFDPYTNLLRATTEAASAMVGGCDSLAVGAFGFDSHLSMNVQRVLREESYLTAVADAAGGSYYIESLTETLAEAAWKLFQQVEAAGGWKAALASGMVDKALTTAREAKAAAISSRRRTMVGVNNFPNVAEKTSDVQVPSPLPNDRFPQTRLAEPFETLKLRSAAHAQKIGRYAKVLLLTRGDLKMKKARATFCLNFFGCGGFDLQESEDYAGTDADLIVLCSSDPEYVEFAKEVCGKVKVPVIVAGNPKEQIPELQALGVQDFVHVFSNVLDTLKKWQDRLGMAPLPQGVKA